MTINNYYSDLTNLQMSSPHEKKTQTRGKATQDLANSDLVLGGTRATPDSDLLLVRPSHAAPVDVVDRLFLAAEMAIGLLEASWLLEGILKNWLVVGRGVVGSRHGTSHAVVGGSSVALLGRFAAVRQGFCFLARRFRLGVGKPGLKALGGTVLLKTFLGRALLLVRTREGRSGLEAKMTPIILIAWRIAGVRSEVRMRRLRVRVHGGILSLVGRAV